MWNEQPDERQRLIHGQIFKHGFLVTVVLLLLNMFMQSFYGEWATPFHQNLLVLMIIIVAVSLEAVLREVYLVKRRMKPIIGILSSCGFVLLGLNIYHMAFQGQAFVQNGQLTETGCSLIMSILILSIPAALLVKRLVERGRPEED